MNTRMPGKLLQKKLTELNNALLFAEGDALVKLQNQLVTDMHVNAAGDIYIVLPKPAQDISAFDKQFPVRLDFFRKGKAFRLKVQGSAELISDAAEIEHRCYASRQLQHKAGSDNIIMLKVTVQTVDYTVYASESTESLSSRIKSAGIQLSEWLFTGAGDRMEFAD